MSTVLLSFLLLVTHTVAVLPSPQFPYTQVSRPPLIEPYVVRLPENFNPSETHPLILFFHGSGVSAHGSLYDPPQSAIVEALLKSGYIVAASDSHMQNWGNNASLHDTQEFYDYLKQSYRISSVGGIGQSMGGLTSLLAAEQQAAPLAAMVEIYPVVDIASVYRDPRFTKLINAAYSDEHWNYPLNHTASIANLPILIYASPQDTWVPKAANTDALAAKLHNETVVTTAGEHGDPSNFHPDQVVRFFDRHLK